LAASSQEFWQTTRPLVVSGKISPSSKSGEGPPTKTFSKFSLICLTPTRWCSTNTYNLHQYLAIHIICVQNQYTYDFLLEHEDSLFEIIV